MRLANSWRSLSMQIRSFSLITMVLLALILTALSSAAIAQQSGTSGTHPPLPNAPSAQKQQTSKPPAEGWPRTFTNGADTFTVYQPQVDKWEGDRIDLYSAVEVKVGTDSPPRYGVVWFWARTEVDKVNRLVALGQLKITSIKFPLAHEKEMELTKLLEQKFANATKTISLDRLEAQLDADNERIKSVEVKNDPPKIIISTRPALLVLIDVLPQLLEVPGVKLQRVINTRSIILFETDKKLYYLRVQDWWLQSKELEGPWEYAKKLPDDMKKAEEYLVSQNQVQNPTGEQTPQQQQSLKAAGKKAQIRVVYAVFGPAELIEVNGDPKYNPIPTTGLE